MQDQTSRSDVQAVLDQAERVVLDLLLDPGFHGPWSVHEIAVAMGDEVDAADAIDGLHAAGLVHRCHEFVFATRPAARFRELADAA
jgi:hypothetical protein